MIQTRPYTNADRAAVLALGNHPGAIDSAGSHCIVAHDGATKGAAIWFWPGIMDPKVPTLGAITLSHPGRRDIYDTLLLAACDAAQKAGHTRGQAMVLDETLLNLMEQDFIIAATPIGTNTETARPGHWVIEFDLAANRKILLSRLAPA
jgi:hypothetical protein